MWYPVADDAFSIEVMDAHGGWIALGPRLCQFLDAYWISGEPRMRGGTADWTFFGSLPGTTSMARQRPDGVNIAVLLNQRGEGELLRKAVDAAVDRITGQVRYAAIWEKRDGPAWQARHGLSADDYQQTFDKLGAEGYRPVAVSGYSDGGAARYAAIWEKRGGPAWQARHGLKADDYQKEFDKLGAAGYRLTWLNGYNVGGQARYAAIWEKRDGPAWQARHGLNADDYQKTVDRLGAEGYRPVVVSGYSEDGAARYAAIWEKRGGPAWQARHGLKADDYQKEFDKLGADGYRLVAVSGYDDGGVARYVAVWEKRDGPAWQARHGLSADDYQKAFDQLRGRLPPRRCQRVPRPRRLKPGCYRREGGRKGTVSGGPCPSTLYAIRGS